MYRAAGVNFRVDLHRERALNNIGMLNNSRSKKNLGIVTAQLKKAGLNQEFLDEIVVVDQSPSKAPRGYMQHLNQVYYNPK